MKTETILPTRNTDWGFFGTITHHADPLEAWPLAMTAIDRATGCPQDAVRDATIASRSLNADRRIRDVLDSRYGRHFADDVANGLASKLAIQAAIDAAAERWMDWTITKRTSRETGIPTGLPYLTGFVIHCEIEAEAFG